MKKRNILSVEHKNIIIFGGCGLLGSEFSKHLCSQGANIFVADLNKKKFNYNFKKELKINDKNLFFIKTNILNKKSLENCLTTVLKKLGSIDVVINTSAIDSKYDKNFNKKQFSSLSKYPLNFWKRSIEINLTGAFILSQVVSEYFNKVNKGHLINIGSNYGLVAPDQSIYKNNNKQVFFKPADYVVSKFGILGLNKYLASYYKNTKIRFNILTPSGVENKQEKFFKKKYSNKTMLNRMSKSNEFNGAIQFLCSDASSYMTGSNLVIDGGWTVT